MKTLVVALGIIFVLLGLILLVHPGFHYGRHEEPPRVERPRPDINRPPDRPPDAERRDERRDDRRERSEVPLAATVIVLVAGAVLIILGARSKS
jgi:uncharacterized membrane protein